MSVTMKIWEQTRKILWQIKAETGETMVEIVNRLALDEIRRIRTSQEQPF